MCIAILNTISVLDKETLNNSWDNNNQGAGMLYNYKGKLKTFKTFEKDELIKEYYKVREKINSPIILHFRISTSGQHNFDNLHPFLITKNIGFVHNGIIDNGSVKYSDTYLFNELLKGIPNIEKMVFNESFQTLISGYIGYSKLIFLNSDNETLIINDDLGHYDKFGNWFSNDSYCQVNNFKYYGNKKVFNDDDMFTHDLKEKTLTDDFNTWIGDCECCGEVDKKVSYSTQWQSIICENCELVY